MRSTFWKWTLASFLAVLTVLPLGKTNKYFETFDRLCLMCVFLITIRSIISSKLFLSLVYGKVKLIMRILLVRKNKYVMQSTALTNKINDGNKMQKNRAKTQTKLTYIVFGILCRHS